MDLSILLGSESIYMTFRGVKETHLKFCVFKSSFISSSCDAVTFAAAICSRMDILAIITFNLADSHCSRSTRSRFGLPTDASAVDELSCSPAGAGSFSSCSANLLPRRPLALAGVLADAALV